MKTTSLTTLNLHTEKSRNLNTKVIHEQVQQKILQKKVEQAGISPKERAIERWETDGGAIKKLR